METEGGEQEESVEDIDAEDVNNPQLVTEYVNEIYSYLRSVETLHSSVFLGNFIVSPYSKCSAVYLTNV